MNSLLRIVYFFIGEPSVSKAVKNIDAAILKLNKAVAHQNTKSEKMTLAAATAQLAAIKANEEAERAKRVADKMADLLS